MLRQDVKSGGTIVANMNRLKLGIRVRIKVGRNSDTQFQVRHSSKAGKLLPVTH